MTLMPEATLARVALEHLQMVDDNTAAPEMLMHCYFARRFLKLALDGEDPTQMPTVTIVPHV
jgi:hypothetical protein